MAPRKLLGPGIVCPVTLVSVFLQPTNPKKLEPNPMFDPQGHPHTLMDTRTDLTLVASLDTVPVKCCVPLREKKKIQQTI